MSNTINKTIRKDLLETIHEGSLPVFSGFTMEKLKEVHDLPVIWSYAFRDGKERGQPRPSIESFRSIYVAATTSQKKPRPSCN